MLSVTSWEKVESQPSLEFARNVVANITRGNQRNLAAIVRANALRKDANRHNQTRFVQTAESFLDQCSIVFKRFAAVNAIAKAIREALHRKVTFSSMTRHVALGRTVEFWNIALSWKNKSVGHYERMKASITSMARKMITALRICNYAKLFTARDQFIAVPTVGATTS